MSDRRGGHPPPRRAGAGLSASGAPALPVRELVWHSKYRLHEADSEEPDLDATWRRVATAVAQAEPAGEARTRWAARFHRLLCSGAFLPGGRIIAGAGSRRQVTLFNCFVLGAVRDSIDGIFRALREAALTMQQGGGIGIDFSTLRPQHSRTAKTGAHATGPVSFMHLWDSACDTLLAGSRRRGAMMATLRCDHPDIEAFIEAKRTPGALTNFNLSVLITDAFMQALAEDADWPLHFASPRRRGAAGAARVIRARALWERIVRAAYDSAEPGVLFIDRINAWNNLYWRERITATNPCGEVPLPPYGACNLGSLNLAHFVRGAFTPGACIDHAALARATAQATRLLDDVIDVSRFPLPALAAQARGSRRIGLGITALGDALLMLGLHYASAQARVAAGDIMRTVCEAAYRASVSLARERGSFAYFEREPYLRARFVTGLPASIRNAIARHGIRNSHLTAIAPAGTISLLAGGVSSGIEPIVAARVRRRVGDADGVARLLEMEDPAVTAWRARGGAEMPPQFVAAADVPVAAQLAMQAAVQVHVDNAISKTVSVPATASVDDFRSIYEQAWRLGLKGCTAYRAGIARGAVIEPVAPLDAPHCCALARHGG